MNKVLIVEDDQIVRNIYSNKLALDGFQVEVAPDAESGWETLQKFEPNVLLLDLILPHMPGAELLRKIRATEKFKALPVIVLSNTYLTSMVQEAWKAGATRCLAKANCTPRQVIDVIRSCVNAVPENELAPRHPGKAPSTPVETTVQRPQETVSAATALPKKSEFELQQDLRGNFIASIPSALDEMRPILQMASKAASNPERQKHLRELQRRLGTLSSASGVSGFIAIANMAAATQALVQELQDRPKNFNASTLRTLASAIDTIDIMVSRGHEGCWESLPSVSVLVVDDEPISRKAITRAMGKANLKAVSVSDPATALMLLEENAFDLVFLDVDMPNMSGFELCAKLRKLPGHAKTPVIFVTMLSDFDSRANSMVSGGTDLIGKPFLAIELAVKALRYVLQSHVIALSSKKAQLDRQAHS